MGSYGRPKSFIWKFTLLVEACEPRNKKRTLTFHEILVAEWGSLNWLIIVPTELGSIIPYIPLITKVFSLLMWKYKEVEKKDSQ